VINVVGPQYLFQITNAPYVTHPLSALIIILAWLQLKRQLKVYGRKWGQSTLGLLGFASFILEYASGQSNCRPFKNRSVSNEDVSNFQNFLNYYRPRFLYNPHCTYLAECESIGKSSVLRTIVHSVPTSGLLPSSWRLTVIDWISLRLSKSSQKTRLIHEKQCVKTTFGLLPPQSTLSWIECISLTEPKSVKLTCYRVSIVALPWSEVTLSSRVMLV